MIPDTLLSLILFLGLIAPGLLYQLLWERRHPALEETAFREASRTALMSLLFSGLACIVIVLIRIFQPNWILDLGQYLRDSKTYVGQHYNLLIQTIALEVRISALHRLAVPRRAILGWRSWRDQLILNGHVGCRNSYARSPLSETCDQAESGSMYSAGRWG